MRYINFSANAVLLLIKKQEDILLVYVRKKFASIFPKNIV